MNLGNLDMEIRPLGWTCGMEPPDRIRANARRSDVRMHLSAAIARRNTLAQVDKPDAKCITQRIDE
jgi:hypothetical protein